MGFIKILSEELANQIAAGEVVEGPSSVVKELVENSIDAEAKKIQIELSNSFRNIRVADNGLGISRDDLELAFKKHATSKIFELKDIYSLISNGFRGEALASISSVSKLTCISRKRGEKKAYKIQIIANNEEIQETGSAEGTSILVEDLFYNTPARLKFLKSNEKERNYLIDLVRSFAFAHPEISFELFIDSKQILKTSSAPEFNQESLRKTIIQVFGKDIEKFIHPVNYNTGELSIQGFATGPEFTRSDKRAIFIIVNKRILSCRIIKSAIDKVYKDILNPSRFPVVIVSLELPPEDIDVNIHPNKKEIKYKDSNLIYRSVFEAISKSLRDAFYKNYEDYQIPLDTSSSASNKDYVMNRLEQIPIIDDRTISPLNSLETYSEIIDDNESFANLEVEKPDKQFIARMSFLNLSVINKVISEEKIFQFGNKTSFEIYSSDESLNKSALASGEFIGPKSIQEKVILWIKSLTLDLLEEEKNKIFKKINKLDQESHRNRPDSSPSLQELEEIWQRDHYLCLYCGRQLIHPAEIKRICKESPVEKHQLIYESLATYDHHLPASKYPILNKESRNLYSSCKKCNMTKSDSLALKTWDPKNEKK
jgi:DNA mismatch repair protein MutL